MPRSILVTGATGKQGGAVTRALIEHPSFGTQGIKIYALTRNTASPAAQKLAAASSAIHLVSGSFENIKSVIEGLPEPPWGVFGVSMVNKTEEADGKSLIDAAVRAGSRRVVFATVDRGSGNDGHNPTYVPHYITKHNIEQHLIQAAAEGPLTYTILRPTFFLDNLDMGFVGKIICTAWRDYTPSLPMQLVDTADIGAWAARSFLEPDNALYKNKCISLAGDALTFVEANKIFQEETGRPIPTTYGFVAGSTMFAIKEVRLMFQWFRETPYAADVKWLKQYGAATDFRTWIKKNGMGKA